MSKENGASRGPAPIETAVIGVGHLGQHHARILEELPGAQLRGVVDLDLKRAQQVAKATQASAYTYYKDLFGVVQAAVISVPTPLHYQIGKDCLEAGIHCLIEKPLTEDVQQAEELVRLAQEKNLILQVGHVERFNPAVIEAHKHVKEPKFIEVNRLGPYDPRVSHIGVVLDLMIHDLDIVLYLVNSKVKSLEAFGAKVLTQHEDIAKCRLRFENGCIVDLSASRISLEQYRKIRIFQADAYISVDYARKDLKIYRKKKAQVRSFSDIEIVKPKLRMEEPLKLELKHFLECIQEGKKPHVTGEHGRDALELGKEILDQLQVHEPA